MVLEFNIEGKITTEKTSGELKNFKPNKDGVSKLYINPDPTGSVFEINAMKIMKKNPFKLLNSGILYDVNSKKPKQCDFACEICEDVLCKIIGQPMNKKGVEACPAEFVKLQ